MNFLTHIAFFVVAPRITVFQVPALAKMSQNATLSCRSKGIPQPRLSWLKNGLPISTQSSSSVTPGVITLVNLQRDDSGTYICLAVNVAGQMSAEGNLTVQGSNNVANRNIIC